MITPTKKLGKRLQVATLPWSDHMTFKKMLGGHCFLFKGKMYVGETKERLMVCVVAKKNGRSKGAA